MGVYEFTMQVFDTLMRNDHCPRLNIDNVTDVYCEVGNIYIEYCSKKFKIKITETEWE